MVVLVLVVSVLVVLVLVVVGGSGVSGGGGGGGVSGGDGDGGSGGDGSGGGGGGDGVDAFVPLLGMPPHTFAVRCCCCCCRPLLPLTCAMPLTYLWRGDTATVGPGGARFKHDAASDALCSALRTELYLVPYDQVATT